MPDPILIPEALAREHAAPKPGESAGESARRIGKAWVQTFIELAGLSSSDRILDLGCGPGRMAIGIGERFDWTNRYLGFDIDRAGIEFAQRAITAPHPEFRFEHLDVRNHYYNPRGATDSLATTFPAADGTFDFAFATSLFTHFFSAEFRRYVAEVSRCLAPGGRFLATFFLLDSIAADAARRGVEVRRFTHRIDEHATAQNRNSPGKAVAFRFTFVEATLMAAGFRDIVHHCGTWGGHPGRHSQDIVVAHKR